MLAFLVYFLLLLLRHCSRGEKLTVRVNEGSEASVNRIHLIVKFWSIHDSNETDAGPRRLVGIASRLFFAVNVVTKRPIDLPAFPQQVLCSLLLYAFYSAGNCMD